jgi:hypothetical protein
MNEKMVSAFLANCIADLFFLFFLAFLYKTSGLSISLPHYNWLSDGVNGLIDAYHEELLA